MKGVIFDLDGVLVDSMPMHCEAWKKAVSEVANIEVNERTIYLLEGMRGIELVRNILEQKRSEPFDELILTQITKRKDEYFRKIHSFKPFKGVRELVTNLKCRKAVVSGSAKKDVEIILGQALGFGKEQFDVVITADDVTKGKPDSSSLILAMEKLNLKTTEALMVENSPLGVEAANRAGIHCILVLNNTPLETTSFKSLISEERIFKRTESAFSFLQTWCNE
ncbi:MAG TPA: HAD-IA family hydrolase [Candidatus Nitrosopolaris sp.]|nr:HAD-IA family hydrolase [Candidatus Nitrosopolaris sp.]